MDFNVATSNLSLYVEDVQQKGSQRDDEDDGMWESVIIKKDIVKDWNVLSMSVPL